MSVEVKIGQVWKDRDKRRVGREFVICNIGRGDLEGTEPYILIKTIGKPGYKLIRKDRFKKYEFTGREVSDVDSEATRQPQYNNLSKTETVS